jgi:hypothetical protein
MTSTNALLTATIIELTMQKGVVAMIFFSITVTHIYRKRFEEKNVFCFVWKKI